MKCVRRLESAGMYMDYGAPEVRRDGQRASRGGAARGVHAEGSREAARQRVIAERRLARPLMTQKEVGLVLGISGELVKKAEQKALRKFRDGLLAAGIGIGRFGEVVVRGVRDGGVD